MLAIGKEICACIWLFILNQEKKLFFILQIFFNFAKIEAIYLSHQIYLPNYLLK